MSGVVRQCRLCPWKVGVDPRQIPGGYSEEKHRALADTIAEPADQSALRARGLKLMACHHSKPGKEQPCAGWLEHQLGVGNNLALRLAVLRGQLPGCETYGPQRQRFEDTLPRARDTQAPAAPPTDEEPEPCAES